MRSWHNRLAYALCLLAPWSLLWLDSSTIFPYITSKTWVFRSIVELAFAFSLVDFLSHDRGRDKRGERPAGSQALLIILSLFIVWSAITALTGIDFYRSVWSNWERMGGLVDTLHWAMYLTSLLIVITRQRTRGMLINIVGGITLVCLIGFFDAEVRSFSTLGNSIYFGNLAVFGLFLSGFLLSRSKNTQSFQLAAANWVSLKPLISSLFLLLAMPVMFAALINSASRSSMIALVAAIIIVMLGVGLKFALRYGKKGVIGLTAIFLVIMAVWVSQLEVMQKSFRNSDTYALKRLGQISLSDQTTIDRLENWNIALDAALSRPWLGWGQENYAIAFNIFYRPGEIDKAKLWFDRAHNAYLDVLLASGAPGLWLYILLVVLPISIVWRDPYWNLPEKAMLIAFFSAFIIKNISGFDTFSSTLLWISVLALILSSPKDSPEKSQPEKLYKKFYILKLSIVIFPITLISISIINIKDYQENRLYAKLLALSEPFDSTLLDTVLSRSPHTLNYAQNSKLAVFDALLTSSSMEQQDWSLIDSDRRSQVFQHAGILIRQALAQQPENFRIKYNAARLLFRLGHHELALQLFKELTQSAPRRTVFWYALAKSYTAQNLDEAANKAYKTAQNLNPDWKP